MLIKLKSGMTIAAGKATEPKYRVVGDKETPLCEFGVAAAKAKDEFGADKTVWLNCKTWRDEAKLAQDTIHKGDIVLIAGTTASRSWKGNDGRLPCRAGKRGGNARRAHAAPRRDRSPRRRPCCRRVRGSGRRGR